VFDSIDSDGDGVLQQEELVGAMRRKNIQSVFFSNDVLMSKAMFNRFFSDMDANHNGEIDFEEFAAAVRKTDPNWHCEEDVENVTEDDGTGGSVTATDTDNSVSTALKKPLWGLFSFRRSNAVRDAEEGPSMTQVKYFENVEDTNTETLSALEVFKTSPRLSTVSESSEISVLSMTEPPALPGWFHPTYDDVFTKEDQATRNMGTDTDSSETINVREDTGITHELMSPYNDDIECEAC
jgi:hypothetical protein